MYIEEAERRNRKRNRVAGLRRSTEQKRDRKRWTECAGAMARRAVEQTLNLDLADFTGRDTDFFVHRLFRKAA